jgi:hypothetical protein
VNRPACRSSVGADIELLSSNHVQCGYSKNGCGCRSDLSSVCIGRGKGSRRTARSMASPATRDQTLSVGQRCVNMPIPCPISRNPSKRIKPLRSSRIPTSFAIRRGAKTSASPNPILNTPRPCASDCGFEVNPPRRI